MKGNRKRKSKGDSLIKYSIAMLFIIGLLFLISGGVFFISNLRFKAAAEHTRGRIIDIERVSSVRHGSRHHSRRNVHHRVTVSYTVDGEDYECELGEYHSDWREGQKITLYYDPAKPENVRTGSAALIPVLFMVLGAFLLIGGTIPAAFYMKSLKQTKLLKENGEILTGTVTKVKIITSVTINGNHPFRAECEYTDPGTGERYLFSSKNVMEDISGFIGSEVKIYAERNNRSNYYVDMEELLSRARAETTVHDFR